MDSSTKYPSMLMLCVLLQSGFSMPLLASTTAHSERDAPAKATAAKSSAAPDETRQELDEIRKELLELRSAQERQQCPSNVRWRRLAGRQ